MVPAVVGAGLAFGIVFISMLNQSVKDANFSDNSIV